MRARRLRFRLGVGVLMACLTLCAVEAALRLSGFGARQPAFVKRADSLGRTWWVTNPRLGENWFRAGEWEPQIRHPREVAVAAEKTAGELRIVVIGESAAYGTPWGQNAAWPAMLEAGLNSAGTRPAEVINLGIRASSLDIQPALVAEALVVQPDLFVLYGGHNEYYGIREPGTLANLRIFQLLQRAFRGQGDGRVGMRADAAVAPEGAMPDGVTLREKVDLERIIVAAGEVPVMVVTPWSNERDVAPIGSYVPNGHQAAGARAAALLARVEAAPETAPAAQDELSALEKELPMHAGVQHGLALAQMGNAAGPNARQRFRAAIDLDTVPIRARSDTIDALRAGSGASALRCDPGFALEAATPGHILDHTVFLDHVHLTLAGGAVVARALAGCISDTPALREVVDLAKFPDLQSLRSLLDIDPVDELVTWRITERYFQLATISASLSRERSVAYYRTLIAEGESRLDALSLDAFASGQDEVHLAIASRLDADTQEDRRLSELRRAVAARPGSVVARRAYAAALAARGDDEAAREEEALAGVFASVSPR